MVSGVWNLIYQAIEKIIECVHTPFVKIYDRIFVDKENLKQMGVEIKVIYWLLIITVKPTTPVFGLIKFSIPKTDVVHTKSGLILHYITEYRPANKIITFSVSLPMYADMCFLIPKEAMGKIPECEEKEATVRVIRETQQGIQDKNNQPIQPVGKQEYITQTSPKVSPTTPLKEKPKTTVTSTINTTTKPTSTINTMTELTSTVSTSTTVWQRMKDLLKNNNGTFSITKANGTLIVNYTNSSSANLGVRAKRFIPAIIGIGLGLASNVLSVVNTLQAANLKAEVRGVKETLGALHLATINNEAQILHIQEGQVKLAEELRDTQIALNRTMALVNQHSEILRNHAKALKALLSQTLFLRNQLDTVTHTLNTHFIHESIERIMAHKLNLLFVHYTDMARVVKMVIQAMNLTSDVFNNAIPGVELITRLLVRQQVDFAPLTARAASSNGILIGKMIFTSYFAAPTQDQNPFSIYEVVPIPFNQDKKRVQLARMPTYLGIEPKSQQFIRWSKEEATICDFEVMPSCRETPVRRKEKEDSCIYQILTDSRLENCRIESFPEKVFIRRVGQHWAISTYKSSNCHEIPNERVDTHILIDNEQITIPEVALITVNEEKALACDQFIIPRAPTKMETPINLIYNESVYPSYKALINLKEILDNETHWEKLPYIPSDMQAILEFISNTRKPTTVDDLKIWSEHPISLTMLIIIGTLILIIIIIVVYLGGYKRRGGIENQIVVAMPMKEFNAKGVAREEVVEKY